jgi:hypothetical protein
MAEADGFPSGSIGSLSYQPGPDETLVSVTLSFVLAKLPAWRDDPMRPADANEKQMNSSLCDFLDTRSRTEFPMVRFKHEDLETERHTVDLGVHGMETITIVNTRGYSIYQPFLVIEAKRLPAPSKDREREYVAGSDKPSGAIERFRLGLHGAGVETAVIVGYIEALTPRHWHTMVNDWIRTMASDATVQRCTWSCADELKDLVVDDEHGVSSSESSHERVASCCTASIAIRHLWVAMRPAPN